MSMTWHRVPNTARLKFSHSHYELTRFNLPRKNIFVDDSVIELYNQHCKAIYRKGAMFDARVFNIPKEEVCNNIFWRQQDAARNSVQMVGRAYFSDKRLHGKCSSQIQDMLVEEHNVNWNDTPTKYKHGSCCIRVSNEETGRSEWIIDNEMPILKGESRAYVDDLIYIGK